MTATAHAIARDFCQQLHAHLGAAQVAEAAGLNAREPDRHVCHSHDFCDANMAMYTALLGDGLDPTEEGSMERWGDLWDQAWSLAKASGFRLF